MAKTVDAKLVNPFIESTLECLTQMAGMKPERKRLYLKEDDEMHGEVSGVIGLSDGITGNCLVSFPLDMAERIVAAFLGETPPIATAMVHDGIGEVANMVAGGAKRRFSELGFRFSISTPTVVAGKRPTKLFNPPHSVSIAIEFTPHPDWPGTFLIEIATKPDEK